MNLEEMRSFNKIFCIGLNKTGTASLHEALKQLGLRSLHWAPEELASLVQRQRAAEAIIKEMRAAIRNRENLLGRWSDYDAYSDIGPISQNFERVDRQYPGSLFIYTDRDEEAWLDSRKRHVERNIAAQRRGRYVGSFTTIDESKWRQLRREHYARVTAFFSERPEDLLTLRICDGEGFERLGPFLGFPNISGRFPARNVFSDRWR